MHDNVYVYYVNLPNGINEAVTECIDGYNIAIDPRQSMDGIRRSLDHALEHIRNDDFENKDVQIIEMGNHRKERKP